MAKTAVADGGRIAWVDLTVRDAVAERDGRTRALLRDPRPGRGPAGAVRAGARLVTAELLVEVEAHVERRAPAGASLSSWLRGS